MSQHGFDDADVCFALSEKGRKQLDMLCQDLEPARREELYSFLRETHTERDREGNTLWYYYNIDWTCNVPLTDAWYLHMLFISLDSEDVIYLVVNCEDELRIGALRTPMKPRLVRSIDFIPNLD